MPTQQVGKVHAIGISENQRQSYYKHQDSSSNQTRVSGYQNSFYSGNSGTKISRSVRDEQVTLPAFLIFLANNVSIEDFGTRSSKVPTCQLTNELFVAIPKAIDM